MPQKSLDVFLEVADKGVSNSQFALQAARAIAASEAYRKYSWLTGPMTNAVGDFRGMVISGQWAARYQILGDTLEVADKAAVFVAVAANVVNSLPEIDRILAARDPWYTKGAKLSAQVASVSLRATLGIVPAGVDLIAFSVGGYLQTADALGLRSAGRANQWVKSGARFVDSTFTQYTDGDKIYTLIDTAIGRK